MRNYTFPEALGSVCFLQCYVLHDGVKFYFFPLANLKRSLTEISPWMSEGMDL